MNNMNIFPFQIFRANAFIIESNVFENCPFKRSFALNNTANLGAVLFQVDFSKRIIIDVKRTSCRLQ